MKITVFTAFSGYDAQLLALRRLSNTYDFEFDLVGWSEIDRHAIKAHDTLFHEYKDRNFGDFSLIDWETVPSFELLTYSSPCQDISKDGMKKGMEKGSGTRSSLLWDVERCIREKRPKIALMENVANLDSIRYRNNLHEWMRILESLGYKNYVKKLNARDYGVPQNRERVFLVSIHEREAFHFYFPAAVKLDKYVDEILEQNVGEKYNVEEDRIKGIINKEKYNLFVKEIRKDPYDYVRPGSIFDITYMKSNTRRGRVIEEGSICPTITCKVNSNLVVYEGFEELMGWYPNYWILRQCDIERARYLGLVITLHLKKEYFNAIREGRKKCEYRSLSYKKRLEGKTIIEFAEGYPSRAEKEKWMYCHIGKEEQRSAGEFWEDEYIAIELDNRIMIY